MSKRPMTPALTIFSFLIAILVWSLPMTSHAQERPQLVTLGADLTPEQRSALLERFGAVDGASTILDITSDEMRLAMQESFPIPPGYTAISATALTCRAPGSSLHVTTEHITKVTAAMYAAALVTAGVGDADLIIAAPADAPAEGMTALTGLFKGLQGGVCGRGTLDPARRQLAYRQLILTSEMTASVGGDLTKAAELVLRAQQGLVDAGNDPAAAGPQVEHVQRDLGVTLPGALVNRFVQLLQDMATTKIDWGTYAEQWKIVSLSDTEVRVATSGTTQKPSLTLDHHFAGVVTRSNPVQITSPAVSAQVALTGSHIRVTRNGHLSHVEALQQGDTITVTLDAAGVVTNLDATSQNALKPAGGDTSPRNAPVVTSGEAHRVQGVVTHGTESTVRLDTAQGTHILTVTSAATRVTRNGQDVQLVALQAGDHVVAQLDADDHPTSIVATSAASVVLPWRRLHGRDLLWCSPLLILLPLLLLFMRRRAATTPSDGSSLNRTLKSRAISALPSGATHVDTAPMNVEQLIIPVIEEQLSIGKRLVERGGVRTTTRVDQVPVTAQIGLRTEHVQVERQPLNQMVDTNVADQLLRKDVIEVHTQNEQAVVHKDMHVVEEVVISKEIHEHVTTVQDTVRHAQIDVAKLPPQEDFKQGESL